METRVEALEEKMSRQAKLPERLVDTAQSQVRVVSNAVNRRVLSGRDRRPDDRRLRRLERSERPPRPAFTERCDVRQLAACDQWLDVSPIGAVETDQYEAAVGILRGCGRPTRRRPLPLPSTAARTRPLPRGGRPPRVSTRPRGGAPKPNRRSPAKPRRPRTPVGSSVESARDHADGRSSPPPPSWPPCTEPEAPATPMPIQPYGSGWLSGRGSRVRESGALVRAAPRRRAGSSRETPARS